MKKLFTTRFVNTLRALVTQNNHIDMRCEDFSNKEVSDQIRSHGSPLSPNEIVEGFKGVQRVLRLLPKEKTHLVWPVLLSGFSSALEIAAIGRNAFLNSMKEISEMDEETALMVHKNARARRSQLLPEIMNRIQNNEPHMRQAKF